jgi:hypothetical protein
MLFLFNENFCYLSISRAGMILSQAGKLKRKPSERERPWLLEEESESRNKRRLGREHELPEDGGRIRIKGSISIEKKEPMKG